MSKTSLEIKEILFEKDGLRLVCKDEKEVVLRRPVITHHEADLLYGDAATSNAVHFEKPTIYREADSYFITNGTEPVATKETFKDYIKGKFALNDDGIVCKIRSGCFGGNGALQPICWEDLEDIWNHQQRKIDYERTN